MQFDFKLFDNTPVFFVPEVDLSQFQKIYGGTHRIRQREWLFPAFQPFLDKVVHDIRVSFGDNAFTPLAQQWVEKYLTEEKALSLVTDTARSTKSYEHQLRGTSKLLSNYRYILDWEMGTGKTKTMIDALSMLEQKTLVLCPLIALGIWEDEIAKHSGGRLTSTVLDGATLSKKHEQLRLFQRKTDVLIVSYDMAKRYGVPILKKEVLSHLTKRMVTPAPALKQLLGMTSDAKYQLDLARRWLDGEAIVSLQSEVRNSLGDSPQWIRDIPYQVIVADESHRIKNIRSERTKICLQLAKNIPRRYLLTGTLSLGDPRDLYPQCKFLAGSIIPESWFKFCETYVQFSPWNKHIAVGFKNMHVLNRKIADISDKKVLADCIDLPERTFQKIPFDMSPEQIRDYNTAVEEWLLEIPNQEPQQIASGAIRVNKLLQLCSGFLYYPPEKQACETCPNLQGCMSGTDTCKNLQEQVRETYRYKTNPKLEALEELLLDILERPDSKCVVWANYTAELDDIENLLTRLRLSHVRVDGTTTHKIKELANRFQTDPVCRVYLAQVRTGISVTLTAAQYMIYYSRGWALEDWLQSLNRNFRIGQTNKTVVFSLCAKNTLEKDQLRALEQKKDISNTLTRQANCLLCNRFNDCLTKDRLPWSKGCVLKSSVTRAVTRVKTIQENP